MKQRVSLIIFSVLLLNGMVSSLFADDIPEGYHIVHREVSVTNLAAFPEYLLIGYITGPMIEGYNLQVIEDKVPLDKGYKFNAYVLFAIPKSLAEQAGGIENIDFKKIAGTIPPIEILDPGDQYVADENPVNEEYYFYTVVKATDDTLTLKLTRQLFKYRNGQPDKTVDY